jgi:YHS domain-containing protein
VVRRPPPEAKVIRYVLIALLIIFVARSFWSLIDGVIEAAGGKPRRGPRTPARAVKLQRDPVCGTFVAPANALTLPSGDSTLYFCSEDCRSKYRHDHAR